jgi:diaminohydroxyphosphoribosylaminopyrimidine deaminase/5-amino-6-(5-phosphoribosylamino)uracil reductase
VHKWRSEEQAILVGTQTALKDNPKLNVRHYAGKNPTRVVIDKALKLPSSLAIRDTTQPTIVFHDYKLTKANQDNLSFEALDFERNLPEQILSNLYKKGLQSVIIEGGAKTIQSFIDHRLWDEARVFIGKNEIKDGLKGPVLDQKPTRTEWLEGDQLNYFQND